MNTTTKRITGNKETATIKTLAVSALLALAVGVLSWQTHAQDRSAQGGRHEINVPQTVQEHKELAEQYRNKAAEHLQEAEAHRKMLAEYSKRVAKTPKEILENTYIKKMRLHCEKYSRAAEALAREAEEMAKYHTMRAKEMEGK